MQRLNKHVEIVDYHTYIRKQIIVRIYNQSERIFKMKSDIRESFINAATGETYMNKII